MDAAEIDYGIDRTLYDRTLAMTVGERIDQVRAFSTFVMELRPPTTNRPFRPREIVEMLTLHALDFVLIGGLAGTVHGSAHWTDDVDIVYCRQRENVKLLARALRSLTPVVPSLPNSSRVSVETRFGRLDAIPEGLYPPRYTVLLQGSETVLIGRRPTRVASLVDLIAMRETAGRTKDKVLAAEYRVLADEIKKRDARA